MTVADLSVIRKVLDSYEMDPAQHCIFISDLDPERKVMPMNKAMVPELIEALTRSADPEEVQREIVDRYHYSCAVGRWVVFHARKGGFSFDAYTEDEIRNYRGN